jgi:CheY-like chemotaxis protein
MPEMGGLECTEIIRKTLPAPEQPTIIALTAHAFQEEKDKCIQSGMNDVCDAQLRPYIEQVLTKPVNRSLLLAALLRCPKLS